MNLGYIYVVEYCITLRNDEIIQLCYNMAVTKWYAKWSDQKKKEKYRVISIKWSLKTYKGIQSVKVGSFRLLLAPMYSEKERNRVEGEKDEWDTIGGRFKLI